jgi:hypothetical protein
MSSYKQKIELTRQRLLVIAKLRAKVQNKNLLTVVDEMMESHKKYLASRNQTPESQR